MTDYQLQVLKLNSDAEKFAKSMAGDHDSAMACSRYRTQVSRIKTPKRTSLLQMITRKTGGVLGSLCAIIPGILLGIIAARWTVVKWWWSIFQ